jgi:hypothetical protein
MAAKGSLRSAPLSQEKQTRWGQPHQIWPSTAAPIPNPINGWQQQSKWRRKIQQQSLGGIPFPGTTVSLLAAQVNVQAYQLTPEVIVPLLTAQITVGAYSPQVAVPGAQGWRQQSKWRRKIQQGQSTQPAPTVVSLLTAQVTVQAYPLTPEVIVGEQVAQVNVQAYTVTPTITATPISTPGFPQARWGQHYQIWAYQTLVSVSLPSASVTVQAYPVSVIITSAVPPQGWLPQSKWRRKYQVPWPQRLPPVLGSGAAGFINITYPTITGQLLYSVAGAEQEDSYGNAVPVGYQGPVSSFKPLVSTPTVTESWHALSLVSGQASASGNGVNGFWYIYRSDNEVELLWDINATNTGGAYIGVMPAGYIPQKQLNLSSGWYGTAHSTYQSNFQPHINIQGAKDPVPGAIYTYGGNVQPLAFFGRAKYPLVAP